MTDTHNRLPGRRTAIKLAGGFAAFSALFPAACMTA
jgi:hypothetical protein